MCNFFLQLHFSTYCLSLSEMQWNSLPYPGNCVVSSPSWQWSFLPQPHLTLPPPIYSLLLPSPIFTKSPSQTTKTILRMMFKAFYYHFWFSFSNNIQIITTIFSCHIFLEQGTWSSNSHKGLSIYYAISQGGGGGPFCKNLNFVKFFLGGSPPKNNII